MKIGIEAQRLFRPHKHGMDIVVLELIRSLQTIDIKNEYYIFVKPDEDNDCLFETQNVHIIPIRAYNYVMWEQVMLPYYANKYALDVLHCTSNTAPLFLSMPFILTLHDVIFMEKINGKNTSSNYQKYGNLYRKWLVPKIIKKCAKIITISEVEKANITKTLGLKNEDVTVIHNGVSSRFGIKPNSVYIKELKEKLGLTAEYFLFLGNVEPRKNVKNTIIAFVDFAAQNPDLKLVITGIALSFVEEILSVINKKDYIDRFVIAGFVDNNSLMGLYSEAKVFLYPSFREGFGLPILEAMAFGVPVITSNISAMPEVAGDAAFMVNPYSVQEITEAMEVASKNDLLRKRKIMLGYQRPPLFTWTKTANKVLEIYESIEKTDS